MTKAARKSLIALAAFVLLLLILLIMAMIAVESRWARGFLEDQVSQRIGGREVIIGELDVDWGWPLGIHLSDFSIANPAWAEHEHMLQLAALDVTLNVGELMTGSIDLERIEMEQPVIHLARREDGTSNWDDLVPDKVDAEDVQQAAEEAPPGIHPDTLTISQGLLTYQDARLEADVNVDFQTVSDKSNERRLEIRAEGQIQDRPLQLSLQGGAPSRALSAEEYSITLGGHLGDIDLGFDGQLHNVQRFETLQGQINVSAPEEADIASLLGQPALTVPSVDFQARLNHEGRRWALENIQAKAGESHLTGMLALVLEDTPRFDVQLHADQIDLKRWDVMKRLNTESDQASEPASQDAGQGRDVEATDARQPAPDENSANLEQRLAQQLSPLREYAGQVDIVVDQLYYGEETLREVALKAQLDTGHLNLQQLRAAHGDGELTAQGELVVQAERLQSSLNAQASQLNLGEALAPLGFNGLGVLNGEMHGRFADGVLTLEDSGLAYRTASMNVQVQADAQDIAEAQAPGVHLQGSGTRHGQEFRFDLTLGPLLDFNNPDQAYPVEGTLATEDSSVQFDGTLTQPLELSALDIAFQAHSDDLSTVNRLFGLDLPEQAPLRLQARLLKNPHEQRWALRDLEAQLGDNQVTGLLALAQGDTPSFDIQLHADRLDLNRWGVMALLDSGGEQQSEPEQQSSSADEPLQQRLAQQLALLRRYQGQIDVSIGQLDYGDEVLRDVALKGRLDTGHLVIQQLHAAQGDGGLNAEGSLDVRSGTASGALDARLDQVDLGQAMAPLGHGELGVLDGEIHVRVGENALELRDTTLTYRAPAQALAFDVQAETRESDEAQVSGVHVEGSGRWQETPFQFDVELGPLLSLGDSESPYAVQGTVTSRNTTLYADGTVTQPFAPESVDARLRLEGPNPAELNTLLGQDLPDMAAYQISGRLRWHDTLLRLTGIRAELGDSDMSGDMRVEWEERPTLWATLNSRQLNESDFEPLWASDDEEDSGQLFSEEPLNLEMLRSMDAVVDYSAIELNARNIPLSDVQLEAELRQGVLTLEPVRIGVGGGELDARLRADAQQSPLEGQLELSVSQVELTPLLRKAELPEPAEGAPADSAGILGGKAELRFQGRSVADIMAGLNGAVEVAVSRGYLDMLVAELLGLDAGEALIGALADADAVPMHCAYARMASDNGMVELEQFYVGTQDTNYTAGGMINLGTEQLDMTFKAHPKDTSLLSANTPVSLEGGLTDLQVSIISPDLVARGVASVIGAIVAPPLAILPWVEPGTGEGVGPGCRQALQAFENDTGQQ